ncbi:nuclear transport factor 2 family protein [Sphaerisporangium corydalis]|uniref:Nuclear transport factor 2 family protein n=1 Tax=Sphaerisporangium corydalis TaxID=1441875 RepID=A0ABV9E890_9ACTN|nr:nuclear transport factor 2 family protein [Sphaerisporangium corydalis]
MAATPTAREVFERHMFAAGAMDPALYAEDVVIETPFAAPGRPRCWEGREAFMSFVQGEGVSLPALTRRDVRIHESADPEVIVVEYELGGTIPGTDQETWAPFIGVLRVREGKVAHWREYQDPIVMAMATGRLPALLSSLGGAPAQA